MNEQDFPDLNRSADDLSLKSQKHFFCALRVHLVTLVIATILSVISILGEAGVKFLGAGV